MIGIICFGLTKLNYIAIIHGCLHAYIIWSVESSEPQSETDNIPINLYVIQRFIWLFQIDTFVKWGIQTIFADTKDATEFEIFKHFGLYRSMNGKRKT